MVEYEQVIKGLSIRPAVGFFGYSSVTLIKDGDENILFDTGGYGVREHISEVVDKIKIDKVFLSHLHFDHCANISLFKGIPVYAHRDELTDLDNLVEEDIYSDIKQFIKESIKSLNIIPFSEEGRLSENTIIRLTPGHTKGHSSLEIVNQQNRILIAGDAVETYNEYLNGPNKTDKHFNINQHLNSFKMIKENYPTIILGHGSVIKNGQLVGGDYQLKNF